MRLKQIGIFIMASAIAALACLSLVHAQQSTNQNQSAQGTNQNQGPVAHTVDPKAGEALNKMGAYLRTLKDFEVNARTETDEVLDTGQKIQLDGTILIQARRPDHLHVDIVSDRKQRQFFYDGKNFTVFAPRLNYYTTMPAPPTMHQFFKQLAEQHGIEMPLVDLFYYGATNVPPPEFIGAYVLGPATIDGKATMQYAFHEADVDWQVWIQDGDTPLPVKLVITTTEEPTQPQYGAVLNWNTSPNFKDSNFAFTPPPNAFKIQMESGTNNIPGSSMNQFNR